MNGWESIMPVVPHVPGVVGGPRDVVEPPDPVEQDNLHLELGTLAKDRGATFRQDFPKSCIPLERGEITQSVQSIETYVSEDAYSTS